MISDEGKILGLVFTKFPVYFKICSRVCVEFAYKIKIKCWYFPCLDTVSTATDPHWHIVALEWYFDVATSLNMDAVDLNLSVH
jgi:hypothetical protein